MKFNYLFQGELNLFTILQSFFPGLHAALSFSVVMPMVSQGEFSLIALDLFSHYSQNHDYHSLS